jgi:hypothetical protein
LEKLGNVILFVLGKITLLVTANQSTPRHTTEGQTETIQHSTRQHRPGVNISFQA